MPTLGAPDPNVKIPASVIAASKRADELRAAATQKPDDTPPVTPESNPSPEPPATPEPPKADWEQRYNSMKGRVDATTREAAQLRQQLGNMQALVASLQAAPASPTPAPARSDVRFVDPKHVQEYGEEFLDVVGKRTQEVVSPELEAMKAELAAVKQQLRGVNNAVTTTAQEKMYGELGQTIPNWDEINHDPKFSEWLNLTDPYSGGIRLNLLRDAFTRNNTSRVIAFFKGYLAEQAATRPADESLGGQSGAPKPPTVDLATLAAPGRARQAAVNTPPEKPTISRAAIAQFYADVQKGRYAGRDAEKVAFEKEIFAAQAERRIR